MLLAALSLAAPLAPVARAFEAPPADAFAQPQVRRISDADRFASLALEDLDGRKVQIGDWSGKVVLLSFWATWCRPCVDELPDLGRLAEKYRDRGFVILAVSLDEGEGRALVRQLAEKLPDGLEMLLGATTEDLLRYDLGDSVPVSILFGRDGAMADRRRGTIDPGTLDDKIERLLGDAAPQKKRFPGAIQARIDCDRGAAPASRIREFGS